MSPYGRQFNESRKAQGFASQAHLDAFYAAFDHTSTCPVCSKIAGAVPVDGCACVLIGSKNTKIAGRSMQGFRKRPNRLLLSSARLPGRGSKMDRNKLTAGVAAILTTVAETETAPEGIMYAALMGSYSLEEFNDLLGILAKSGLVTRTGYHEVAITPEGKAVAAKIEAAMSARKAV